MTKPPRMHLDRIKDLKGTMDNVSPSFCMAKWHHVTMYMARGQTHSCYHPAPHDIPLSELKQSPSALHNTREKIRERQQMIQGERPSGCQYCWNIEDLGSEYISDRHDRNASIYNPDRLANIIADPEQHVNPQYIEISFGNECNFKCGYCHPMHSSSYTKEIEQHGPYTSVMNHRNDIDWYKIYPEEGNPYIRAWWDWWPEMSKTLDILRITGGEPLLQQSTWRLLDDLIKNPLPGLELNINSNLGVKSVLVDRLCEKIKYLTDNNCIKTFKLYTSVDTWADRAEYLRTGMDLELWERNLLRYLNNTQMPITFMITFNILSVTSFKQLLDKILEWRRLESSTNSKNGWQRIRFDTPYLKEPLQYDINILPKDEYMPYMYNNLEFIKQNTREGDPHSFTQIEYERFKRLVKYMETTQYTEDRILQGRQDFHNWFTEYDRRRGTSFPNTFPEMMNFFNDCKGLGSAV